MKTSSFFAAAALAITLAGCTTYVGPVEVTRFHDQAALSSLGQGTIAIEPAPGFAGEADSLEFASYENAVARELERLGYETVADSGGTQVAQLKIDRFAHRSGSRGPVSVGVGGRTGGWGSGVGAGVGINLGGGGGSGERVTTDMAVMIRDRASNATLWEGRASFTASASAPAAQTQLGAAKLAEALFRGFPGENGKTIAVP